MNANIDVELMHKNFRKRAHNANNNNNKNNKNQTKLCIYNFFSINEIKISECVKNIPYYSMFYGNIVEEWNYLEIAQLGEKTLEKVELTSLDREKRYILLKYSPKVTERFADVLFSLSTPKSFLHHIIAVYSDLLENLQQLNKNNICFFDLCSQNIFFKNNKPLLCNFQNSLLKNRLKESQIEAILSNIEDYTCKPLEVHVLFYLFKNCEETLSYYYIEMIVDMFIETKPFFSLLSSKHKENYKDSAILFLKPLINQPKSAIIQKMLSYVDTWDNYSLSSFFLHIVGNIMRIFGLKEDFMKHFFILLSKNINPDPLKRETWEKTREGWNRLFVIFTDWSFVKAISLQKMNKLHELL
jgi:hypothetical protein